MVGKFIYLLSESIYIPHNRLKLLIESSKHLKGYERATYPNICTPQEWNELLCIFNESCVKALFYKLTNICPSAWAVIACNQRP